MTSMAAVGGFLGQQTLAVVGVSRSRRKFGNIVFRSLKEKGYRVLPVNPNVESVEGERCYPSLAALPEPVGGAVLVVPPPETEQVVREAAAAGIRHIWMQQGAESDAAIRYCEDEGLNLVHGECIMMFAEPVGFGHRLHRLLWGLLGKLPQ